MRPTMSSQFAVFSLLLGLAGPPLVGQSRPTLRQLAIEHGGLHRMVHGDGPRPSFANIVKTADLIVEGTVRSRVSYLTADERDVYTDYELTIGQVLFQKQVFTTPQPGVTIPMVFKRHGGRVMIDGLAISVNVTSNNASVTLKEGDHVYLFAKRDANDGKWLLTPYDVFKIGGADVVPPDEFRDLPKSVPQRTFLQKIHELQPAAALPF